MTDRPDDMVNMAMTRAAYEEMMARLQEGHVENINAIFARLFDDWNEKSCRWFPGVHDNWLHELVHHGLGLGGEAGEVVNIIKKIDRDGGKPGGDLYQKMHTEIIDTLCYLVLLGSSTGINWAHEIDAMNHRNAGRWG
jgi:hypothetical protein